MLKLFTAILLLSVYYSECCVTQREWYAPAFPIKAIAILKGEINNTNTNQVSRVVGTVQFQQNQKGGPVTVTVNVNGLQTGSQNKHGLHIHAIGINTTSDDITAICGSSGPHFNPDNKLHGDIKAEIRHVGDYGNVISSISGAINQTFTDLVSQLYGPNSVIGRTIVLHALEDDLGLINNTGSQTTGNSGARVACGVIGFN